MTRTEINIAIQKNRTALMRIVLCWLIAASLFKSTPERMLPRRIGFWVLSQIFKAELATYYLRAAAGLTKSGEMLPIFDGAPLTIGNAIERLKVVKKLLVCLRDGIKCQRVYTRLKAILTLKRSTLVQSATIASFGPKTGPVRVPP